MEKIILIILIISTLFMGNSIGGPFIRDIREILHTKQFDNDVHGEIPNQKSAIANINNYQELSQRSMALAAPGQGYQHQPFDRHHSDSDHMRGDYGSLSNYDQHKYGGIPAMFDSGFVNSNIKAGGLKYGANHDSLGYGSYNALKQQSYHHRVGPKFGQHHDTNIFGNAKLGSATSLLPSTAGAESSSPSLVSTLSSSSSSSPYGRSLAVSSSSSSSSSSSGGVFSPFNTRGKPWRR